VAARWFRARRVAQGLVQGIERGAEQATSTLRKEQRTWLGRQATRRFGRRAGESLGEHLANVNSAADFEQVSDWIVDCASEEELLATLANRCDAR